MGAVKQISNYGTAYSGEGGYRSVASKDNMYGPVIRVAEIGHPLTAPEINTDER